MQINDTIHSERLLISMILIAKSHMGAAPTFSVTLIANRYAHCEWALRIGSSSSAQDGILEMWENSSHSILGTAICAQVADYVMGGGLGVGVSPPYPVPSLNVCF